MFCGRKSHVGLQQNFHLGWTFFKYQLILSFVNDYQLILNVLCEIIDINEKIVVIKSTSIVLKWTWTAAQIIWNWENLMCLKVFDDWDLWLLIADFGILTNLSTVWDLCWICSEPAEISSKFEITVIFSWGKNCKKNLLLSSATVSISSVFNFISGQVKQMRCWRDLICGFSFLREAWAEL